MLSPFAPRGVYCAALTPLTADLTCDHAALAEHCRYLLAQGCAGIALLGTTGEANSFSVAERMEMLERLIAAGIPADVLWPGTGCASISDSVALSRHAVGQGVAGVVLLPPFYYKDVTVQGLFDAYKSIIDRVAEPALRVVLYHIPPISQIPLPFALIERLVAAFPDTIVGIKDSGGKIEHMLDLIKTFPTLAVLAGADPLLLPVLEAGGAGCITATSNIAAGELVTIYKTVGDPARRAETEHAQARITDVRARASRWPQIAALKAATARRTGNAGWARVRPPLVALSEAEQGALAESLVEVGAL
jgi:4-hydroxy-tetrahydrodipicolinate synthase